MFKMKGIFVILDGLGDLPHSLLGGKTPLEAADCPNLDFFATRGKMGYCYTVKPGFVPESDEAIVSLFGNDLISSSRGQLEAKGCDIGVQRGDLAFRVNFGTIDSKNKKILDRRAGRTLTNEEAQELALSINQIEMPFGFVFEPSVQHRAALVFRGGFSDAVSGNDLVYSGGKKKSNNSVGRCIPLDETENTVYTASVVNDFLEKVHMILEKHPVNLKRIKKGLLPANYLFIRGAGIECPKLKQYKKWVSLGYMPLEIGFSKISGMKVFGFEYPRLEGIDSYGNLYEGLELACKNAIKMLKKFHKTSEYAYIHIKEIDLPGHDNKPFEKKQMIEYVDKTLFKFLRKFCPSKEIKLLVTGDHSTPCRLKDHSDDPVPVLFYDRKENLLEEKSFSEREARVGVLRKILGKELLSRVGFDK
jgi:2,3-bisphosphoglycerate-independent phosphoglycerate mutase